MSPLKLHKLTIEGYRSLEEVTLERIGRLNLITGPNNVGKSSLLEAIRLWAAKTDINTLIDIIDSRDESLLPVPGREVNGAEDSSMMGSLCLFSGYPSIDDAFHAPISINGGDTILTIVVDERESGQTTLPGTEIALGNHSSRTWVLELATNNPGKAVPIPIYSSYSATKRRNHAREHRSGVSGAEIPCISVSSTGLEGPGVASRSKLWDRITLTDKEQCVLRGLEIIDPHITGVNYIRNGTIPIVRLSGVERPVPLQGLGYGVSRLFDILLALVNAEDGFLLIDEFENGLHYSIQEQAWKTVLDLAVDLNVQVFATTHSSDCVEAFERVSEGAADEMILTRLISDFGTVRAETLGSEKLALRLDLGQEVR